MTSEEYIPIIRGPLKLKGGVPDGVVKKKKKKKKLETENKNHPISSGPGSIKSHEAESETTLSMLEPESSHQQYDEPSIKTATEIAHEESRKKRLLDRLKKEGLKTHKQRVEDLNKYLSNLSEHHDMPRIGPG